MRKLLSLAMALCMLLALGVQAETLTGEAQGYGGTVQVIITKDGEQIVAVEITGADETPGIGSKAIEQLPAAIIRMNGAQVDVIAGATVTSQAILKAIEMALGAMTAPAGTPSTGEVFLGEAEGFGGPVSVTVTKDGDKIVDIQVVADSETPGISDPAIEQIPGKIIEANSTQVDVVAGATYTSQAIISAVEIALGLKAPQEEAAQEPAQPVEVSAADAYIGFGVLSGGRIGPGKDDKDVQVYSVNQVFANAIFDKDGKLLFAHLDQMEVATPNYDGNGMPHFAGFPGQGGYNYDENHDGVVDSVLEVTNDTFQADISQWMTKRQRGDAYRMGTGTWAAQADKFAEIFVGKTVDEMDEWFTKYTGKNGRPLQAGLSDSEDSSKYMNLGDDEKAMLADVVTGATMSLNDSHGNIVGAIRKAYDNRQPLSASASAFGFGVNNSGRIGPGKDDKEVQVYSINQVFATSLFDEQGKLAYLHLDQLEVATPNYDGEGMPHFSGFPGQAAYNYDSDHDGKVDATLEATNDSFLEEIASWATKRERGDGYKMGTGTWTQQADAFAELFVGKTVDEIDEWFAKYTAKNGRPLKEGLKDEDAAKYEALTADEKAMLADVTTAATMSLNDGHGNILAAIRASFENRLPLTLTLGE